MTEAQHQQNVIKWSQQADIRQRFPELKLLHHITNERKCTPIQGRMLKLQGVKSGVPDLHLPVARCGYHSLYIEMKAEKGRTSDNQDWWIAELEGQGNKCTVCHSWKEAVLVLEKYLCGQLI